MSTTPSSIKHTRTVQQWLTEKGFHAFILPRTDEYQGEYLAPYAERVQWLTGFSGSAGTVVVGREKSAIFVDGRYTVQVTREICQDMYEIHNVQDVSPTDWLKENLKEGDRIAYDPWLFTQQQLEMLARSTGKRRLTLSPVKDNPIDIFWHSQPDRPMGKVEPYPLEYAGMCHREKIQKVVQTLKNKELRAYVFTRSCSIAWLFNIRGNDVPFNPVMLGYATVYQDGTAHIYTNGKKIDRQIRCVLGNNVYIKEEKSIKQDFHCFEGKVGMDFSQTSPALLSIIHGNGTELVHIPDMVYEKKAFKNPVEQEAMRKYHIYDGVTMVKMLHWIDTTDIAKQNEWKNARQLEQFRVKAPGFKGYAFDTISAFGSNGAICHYRVEEKTAKKFTKNALYLLDSGSQYTGATTDITRTVPIGVAKEEQKRDFTLVLQGFIALMRLKFPASYTLEQLDIVARIPLLNEGKNFDHGTGHGVGAALTVHEGPLYLSKKGRGTTLDVGAIVSNEPGYYVPNAYGIRIENLMIAQDAGKGWLKWENITWCPIDTRLIQPDLLSVAEKHWLNTYHALTYEKLFPWLKQEKSDAVLQWLEKRCQPI